MRKINLLLASTFTLLLIGASCGTNYTTENTEKSTNTDTSTKSDSTTSKTNNVKIENFANSTDLNLSGQATENKGTVSLSWTAPQDLKDKVEAWRLLYGKDANPTFPASWYFERGPSHFDKVWSGLPSGSAHIRVCAVINNECSIFSNDLEVDIK